MDLTTFTAIYIYILNTLTDEEEHTHNIDYSGEYDRNILGDYVPNSNYLNGDYVDDVFISMAPQWDPNYNNRHDFF